MHFGSHYISHHLLQKLGKICFQCLNISKWDTTSDLPDETMASDEVVEALSGI